MHLDPSHMTPCEADLASETDHGRAPAARRPVREKFAVGTRRCQTAVLMPRDDPGLPVPLREAPAQRILFKTTRVCAGAVGSAVRDDNPANLATGGTPTGPGLATIAARGDPITLTSERARETDLAVFQGCRADGRVDRGGGEVGRLHKLPGSGNGGPVSDRGASMTIQPTLRAKPPIWEPHLKPVDVAAATPRQKEAIFSMRSRLSAGPTD